MTVADGTSPPIHARPAIFICTYFYAVQRAKAGDKLNRPASDNHSHTPVQFNTYEILRKTHILKSSYYGRATTDFTRVCHTDFVEWKVPCDSVDTATRVWTAARRRWPRCVHTRWPHTGHRRSIRITAR